MFWLGSQVKDSLCHLLCNTYFADFYSKFYQLSVCHFVEW